MEFVSRRFGTRNYCESKRGDRSSHGETGIGRVTMGVTDSAGVTGSDGRLEGGNRGLEP